MNSHVSWGSEGCAEVVEKWCILEQFSEGAVLENSGRAPYPTPKLGISARHAVRKLSGCGVGAQNPIGNPAVSTPRAQKFVG